MEQASSKKSAFGRALVAVPLIVGGLLLGACGTDTTDRGVSGAGIGAAGGAAIGAIFGGVGALPGAIIGAAVGGGTGAVSSPQQIDLGQPVWRQ
jgi:hypothetical protein